MKAILEKIEEMQAAGRACSEEGAVVATTAETP